MFAKTSLRPWRYSAILLLLAALPYVVPNSFYLTIAQEIALLGIASIGLNFLLGLSGQISLGQAGFFALGAYTSGLLALKIGLPTGLSVPIGAMMAGVVGVLVGLVALRARSHYLAMVTLAFGFIVGIIAQRWVDVTGGSQGLVGLPQIDWGDPRNAQRNYFWTVAAILAAIQIVGNYLMDSRAGRVLQTIAENESFASSVGVKPSAWRVGAFIASAILAGLAGALFVHQMGYISSDSISLDRSLAMLIVVVLGGLGQAYGPILGATFLVAMNQATADLYTYSGFIFGGLLIAVMVFMPHGLSGLLRKEIKKKSDHDRAETVAKETFDHLSFRKSESQNVLELENVSKSYFGVKALKDVSLTVKTGTVHALIGPNGAGKSTLINVISGLYAPDGGAIRFSGRDVTADPAHIRAKHGLARTFQNLQLVNRLTVIENVMLGLPVAGHMFSGFGRWLLGRPHEDASRSAAMKLLESLGVERYANSYPGELSYGHRKLVELARALAQQPALLLLDEPIAGLNEEESMQIAAGIKQLRRAGLTIFLVEHDMPFVMAVADEITVLDYGVKIAAGRPDEIRKNQVVIEAYLGAEVSE